MKGTLAGGYTELMMACEDGDMEAVRALASSGPLEARNQAGYTALGLAIKAGQGEIVRELLTKGADVNARNNAGQSMLFLACWRKHKPMVKALLAAGAQVDEADQRGWTPLMIAVYNDLRDIVEVLLAYKPNLDAKDCVISTQFGKKAIDRAKSSEIRTILQEADVRLQYGAQPTAPNAPRDCDSLTRFLNSQQVQRKTRVRDSVESLPAETIKPPVARKGTNPGKPGKDCLRKTDLRPSSSESNLRDVSPKRDEAGSKTRVREELDRHIQASMNSLGAKLAADNAKEMQTMLNAELKTAEELLQAEVQNALIRSSKEVYMRLQHNLMVSIDQAMRDRGIHSVPSLASPASDFHLSLTQPKPLPINSVSEPFRAYEQLLATPPSHDLSFGQSKSTAGLEDLKAELMSHIGRHSEDLEVRLAKVTRGCIAKEVTSRVQRTKAGLLVQLRDWLGEVSAQIERRLEERLQSRVSELAAAAVLPPSTLSPQPPAAPNFSSESAPALDSDSDNKDFDSSAKLPTKRSVSEKRGAKGKWRPA